MTTALPQRFTPANSPAGCTFAPATRYTPKMKMLLQPSLFLAWLAAALILPSINVSAQTASVIHTAHPKPVICIDPGHPSEVGRGTEGRRITEIEAAWIIAQRMKTILLADGYTVVLTKSSENQFVKNRQRAETANASHAALMVRLHCDGGEGIGSGLAVYAPDRQGRAADGKIGPTPEVIAASQSAAKIFYKTVADDLAGKLPARGLHSDTATRVGGLQGALTGSIYSQVPVVLVEMCVLTNSHDEAFIRSDSGQAAMAHALVDGAEQAARSVKSPQALVM